MDCTTIGAAATDREITEIEDLYKVLASVMDGRCKRRRRYEAADLLTAMMLAELAGEEAWSGIAQWVRLRLTWLQQVIPLPKAPCTNCYRYLCERIDAMELNAKVAEFFVGQAREEGGDGTTATANEADSAVGSVASMRHWACDGKELRSTYRLVHGERQRAQGVFCVYDVSHADTQALLPIESKGFEQAVFCQWLHTTQLNGCVVTADALHTHPAVCRAIRRSGGHYLLIAKRNQCSLHEDIPCALVVNSMPIWAIAGLRCNKSSYCAAPSPGVAARPLRSSMD